MQPAADPRRIDERNQLYFREIINQADKAEKIDVKGWADTVQARCPDYFSSLSGLYSHALLASVLEMTFAMRRQIQPTSVVRTNVQITQKSSTKFEEVASSSTPHQIHNQTENIMLLYYIYNLHRQKIRNQERKRWLSS